MRLELAGRQSEGLRGVPSDGDALVVWDGLFGKLQLDTFGAKDGGLIVAVACGAGPLTIL